jgi:hypothetical protein
MVKSQKLWKVDFFKNDDDNGGAMAEAIKQCPENNIVIHSQTKKNGRLWGYLEPNKFLNMIEKNYGLYEVITQFPHKVYFDVDGKCDRQHTDEEFKNWIDQTIDHILPFFPNAEIAVSGSNTENKKSIHIIVNNYIIRDEEDRQKMKILVKHIRENIDLEFDHTVYTKNRNMKIINQSKDDGRVQEIIINSNFKAHCITCFINEKNVFPFPELPEPVQQDLLISKSKKTFDLGELPKLTLTCPENIDILTITPEQVLSLLPNTSACSFTYRHLICRFCHTNGISFETFFAWIVQRFNGKYTNEKVLQWQHHWNNIDKFPPATIDKLKPILKYYYPHITKDIHFRNFSQTFELPTECIEKIETINQECFENSNKYLVFNVGMGGGKTAQTIDFLKKEANFLWIAPNKALATNTHKRFEDAGIKDVCHYETIKTKEKKEGKMKLKEQLIICLNSIHYINEVNYDVVVIDEIETLIDKFLGDFLEQGKSQLKKGIWYIFVDLFRKAKKVLLLDAFITTKTINFIRTIEKEAKMVIFERINEPQTRTIRYVNDQHAMLQDIIEKLRNGCKLFIFYPYKKSYNDIYSMEQIHGLIKVATNKEGIFYNADVDDNIKKGLKDVNLSWQDKNYVITNNIITCGVNYENLDFDYKYIFVASHNTPRDIIQVSYRARHLNSGIIKICYLGKMNQNNTWLNDCEKINCPIYNKTYKDILIEKKAPLKRSFQLFCVKAHYKQTTDNYKINETIERELKKILEEQNAGMTYNNIPDIDFSEAQIIESKCFAQQATMIDKYALNKYYFNKSFLDNSDKNMLEEIWNDNFCFFFRRLSQVMLNEKDIFNKIANENKLKCLFPVDIKKIKLSNELKEEIFKQFSFKFITSGSANNKILKEIYNTYFGKNIIATKYEDNRNVEYTIHNDVYRYYEYAKNNLILDSLTYMTYNNLHPENEISEDVVEI